MVADFRDTQNVLGWETFLTGHPELPDELIILMHLRY